MKCNINNCGGEVVDDEPHYIPLGKDMILRITCGVKSVVLHMSVESIKNWRESKTENCVTNCMSFTKETYTDKLKN